MYINPILKEILKTKRPTNNEAFCTAFTASLLSKYGIDYEIDKSNNVIVDMGSDSCFTSHTDTVDNHLGKNKLHIENGVVTVKDGGVLGADCGTGMYIMIRMILEEVPGLYVFFASEERGRIGSNKYDMPLGINRCVSFDRKGTDDLITHQSSQRGCSDAFADAFIASFGLPYKKDPTGVFTDSYTFFDTVPECINLSVGYYDQHTKRESQDLVFLESLVDACISMDWGSLPTERDPKKVEYLPSHGWGGKWGKGWGNNWLDDEDDNYYGNWGLYEKDKVKPPKVAAPQISKDDDDDDPLLDFVYSNPELTACYLEEYGITIGDLEYYKSGFYTAEDDEVVH